MSNKYVGSFSSIVPLAVMQTLSNFPNKNYYFTGIIISHALMQYQTLSVHPIWNGQREHYWIHVFNNFQFNDMLLLSQILAHTHLYIFQLLPSNCIMCNLTISTPNQFGHRINGSWIFCKTKPCMAANSTASPWGFGFIEDSRTTDFWLRLFVLVVVRITYSWQLWVYLKHWLTMTLHKL